MALPEIGPAQQQKLQSARIIMIGAGGLGTAALPYLAGAGMGHITIIDHDSVSRDNLHRQTIFRDDRVGQSKAQCAADYLRALNPDIDVRGLAEKLTLDNGDELCAGFDLLLDGSDNFETKILLNEISIRTKIPLISASVEHFNVLIAVFAGYEADAPCYTCLFPEIPFEACNCSEAGILGTAAGLAGLYQAHIALCLLLGLDNVAPGLALSADLKKFRTQRITLVKNSDCVTCSASAMKPEENGKMKPVEILPDEQVRTRGCVIIDVRTDEEVAADPIPGALHMVLDSISARYNELPQNKPLAFACTANMRSLKAAQFMRTMGYDDVYVLDRAS
ncbi:MAG: ThiF family adenylyltransferase [Alphaproteobacteria bacterium]